MLFEKYLLYFHELLILVSDDRIDVLDSSFDLLLNVIEFFLEIVLGQFSVFLHLLESIVLISSEVSYSYLGFFAVVLYYLGQLFTSLLCQLRDSESDNLAVVCRVDADVGFVDSSLDITYGLWIKR